MYSPYRKFVNFDEYCPKCKYDGSDENDMSSPCFECLYVPARTDSHKPINFKEKK